MTQQWGATREDWEHLAYREGLIADLLPVVSNPHAQISVESKMQALGKTPSRYNKQGFVAGIPGWTNEVTTPPQVAHWMTNPDYGICIQTRSIRAVDVDVDDPALAQAIRARIDEFFGSLCTPTIRKRANSPKFLAAFRLPGQFAKRILKTAAGNIEFLANGQQFVAIGTHPSGARYEWEEFSQPVFWEFTVDQFEGLWLTLENDFGVDDSVTLRASLGARVARVATDANDAMVDWLHEHWEVRDVNHDGRIDIKCPFEDEHTTDSGASSTSYYPAGVGGYGRGHFKCLHAHCAHRTDDEFISVIGNPLIYDFPDYTEVDKRAELLAKGAALIDDLFETTPAAAQPAPQYVAPINDEARTLQLLVRDQQQFYKATLDNVVMAISASHRFSGFEVRYDTFQAVTMISAAGANQWRQLKDSDYTATRQLFERKEFRPIGKELMRDCIELVAERRPFDTAQEWLRTVPAWDGVCRVETFMPRVFGTEDTPYTRAVGRYIWTALAGRIISPGTKADMAPIIYGRQGLRKSTAVKLMSPSVEFFREITLTERDENLARRLRGCLIAEIGELRGLHTRDLDEIKAYLSQTHDNWVPKFKEHATVYPRRWLAFGTTNQRAILADETGNRRFLPVTAHGVAGKGRNGVSACDCEYLVQVRLQLWAEGAAMFLQSGVADEEAERLAGKEHEHFRLVDAWEEEIAAWLETDSLEFFDADSASAPVGNTPADRAYLRSHEVLTRALGIRTKDIDRRAQSRLSAVMAHLGYVHARAKIRDGSRPWVWTKSAHQI